MSDNSLFTLTDVSFAYGTDPVLQEINLCLPPGKFYGVVGPNGCGKTTFLDLLIGARKQLTGTIVFNGKQIHAYAKRELARQLALVPQEFDTGFGFTVEEIVLMGRHPHIDRFSSPSQEDWLAVDQAMECIGISKLKDRYTNNLSGGQKQRAVVARALAQNAPVLLFDEATASLDVKYTLQIFNIARQLVRAEGRTVIAVIHNLNLAAAYCDQLLFMKDGRILCHGPTDQTLTAETIAEVFDVQAQVVFDPFNKTRQVSFQYWQQ
ncbi:ABC transporter ATP-binding protein [Desulfopila sp. IMCC35006]|uniref:ABC transporter ATP-binding protein n=1 Tax=Desulfopila sp. IMCC35006 TaxID=2569542 RepID=UPI0010AD0284|nr:ABC transporter ATP-binding protein [Desulfopila sp. IMCC35006]TKB26613.1 ABC transporter ATP-binding protein [Desulfopila sp. IMCC35006]